MEYLLTSLVVLFLILVIVECKKYNVVNTEHKIDLSKQQQEKEFLSREIIQKQQALQEKQREFEQKNRLLKDVKAEYQDAINNLSKVKAQSETAAKDYYESFLVELQLKYDKQMQSYEDIATKKQEEIKEAENKLASLKSTRAAIEQAYRQEEEIKSNKDLYRINISDRDKEDIKALSAVRYQISKPRLLDMLIWQTYYQPIAKQKFPIILGDEKVCGIYKLTNTLNQKCYIGQAIDMRERWLQHCKKGLRIDTPQGNKLYDAMIKDGLENFTFELLEKCSKEELNQKEKYYIEMYNSYNFGYNSNTGVK